MSAEGDPPQRGPDVVGQAEVVIRATAEQVLALVMDVQRYAAVDAKIGAIHWVQRSADGDRVTFRFTPRLGPVPALLRSTQHITRRGEGLLITPEPSWTDRLARFQATVECAPHGHGVLVRRRLAFWLAAPLRPVLGPALRRWLAKDVPAELEGARRVLEGEDTD